MIIMKKKIIFTIAVFASLFAFGYKDNVQAASYGRIGHVVTPANMRGKWVYKGSALLGQKHDKLYKVRIGKHHVDGIKLYQADLAKTSKYARNYKKYHFIIDQTMTWGNASIFNKDGIQWLNVNGWTAGAGNGTSYGLVQKKVNGQDVTALAIGVGYKPFIAAYAYRVPSHHHDYDY
ncbi:hypothetical protein FC46_GL001540 [Lactobacillus kalixensis DSM 16043]|uniref:Surface layer protein A domain-containing protein n=2 Tax=Lactobacillus kalixensis TaxID=227944 RepID=A0A0R1UJL0_9LACO|nr:hypothetical protein FC46_GL001540 [Lactobacillus kalixensis DSM 16043]